MNDTQIRIRRDLYKKLVEKAKQDKRSIKMYLELLLEQHLNK